MVKPFYHDRGLCISLSQTPSRIMWASSVMCGRYVSPDEASIEREFNLVHTEWQFPPSFNVAPTQSVPGVRSVERGRRGCADGLRWVDGGVSWWSLAYV